MSGPSTPLLAEGGSVVITTAVVNMVGLPSLSAYVASKQLCGR